jgi:hypothetical protein
MIDHGSFLILESRLLKHHRARYLRASDAVGGRIFAGKTSHLLNGNDP